MAPTQKVLVVEDEPFIRIDLAAALEEDGFTVLEAGNVLEAVAVLAKNEVDAVITDVDMPGGLNGLDLVDLISGFARSIAIVVTSGGRRPNGDSLPPGAIFLAKPCLSETVVSELRLQLQIQRPAGSPDWPKVASVRGMNAA